MIARLKQWARLVKRDVIALWIAARDRRTPLLARGIAAAVAAYAVSPIDLIPDFIPVLGLLDDLIIVPAGILAAVKLISPELMRQFREQAESTERPRSTFAAIVIIGLWLGLAALVLPALPATR